MHRHKSGKGWRNVMKMKRILTGMLGAAILAAGVNLLSVQAAENAGVMEYIAATEYIEETEAAEPENAEKQVFETEEDTKTADMGELGALIAPRPFFVESGEKDGLNGKSGLKE